MRLQRRTIIRGLPFAYWCAEGELLKLHCDPFYLSAGVAIDIVDWNESIQTARHGDINQRIATLLLKGILHCSRKRRVSPRNNRKDKVPAGRSFSRSKVLIVSTGFEQFTRISRTSGNDPQSPGRTASRNNQSHEHER